MDKPRLYEIKVKGHLDSAWSDWFGGLEPINQEDGDAILTGQIPDQAALYGVLARLGSLGLALISVNAITEEV